MADHAEDNDPFEEDIIFDEAGLLGGKMPRSRQQATAGFLPTFMLFIRTVCLCIAFLALGMCVSVSGGPLIKLELSIGQSVNMAFQTFTARSVGMLLGGFLGSLLFEVYNRQFLMFVSLVWVAVSVTVLPFTVPTALWWTFLTTAALGMGLGFLFTGGNVMCLDLWGRQGGASLQALHFSFAVGAFIVPLVIQPFFVGTHPVELHNTSLLDLPTTTLSSSQLLRSVRDLESQSSSETTDGTFPSVDLENMSTDDLRRLTSPVKTTTVNDEKGPSSNAILMDSGGTGPPVSTFHPETTVNLLTGNASSTAKPAKMKPDFIDATGFEPDGAQVWKKKTEANAPAPEKSETEAPQETTIPPATTTTTPLLIYLPEVTEMDAVTLPATTWLVLDVDSGSITNPVTVSSEAEIEATPNVPQSLPPTTSTPLSTTLTTTTTTITTTTSTTTTTTTTTPKPPPTTIVKATDEPITPVPAKVNKQVYNSVYADKDDTKNLVNTDLMISGGMGGESYDGGSIQEPVIQEMLDVKAAPFDELVQRMVNGNAGETIIPSTPFSVHHASKPGTYSNRSDEGSNYLDNMAQRFKDYGVTKVHLAYICIGIFIILNALISVVILCHNPRETRSKQDDGNMSKMQKSRVIVFTAIFSMFMFMSEALQGAVHHLLASSATDTGLAIIEEKKIDGQALFWGLVCLVRFLCILASGCLRVKPGKLLTVAVLFSFIGSVFLAIGSFGKDDFVWGGVVFLALGLAPILPTSLLWMAQYMRVTHRMCALMIVLASFGNSLAHSLLTQVAGNTHTYAYILVTISFVSLFFLLVSICVIYSAQRSKSLGVPVGYQLARQHEEEDSIEVTPSGSAVFTPHDTRLSENGEAGQSLLID